MGSVVNTHFISDCIGRIYESKNYLCKAEEEEEEESQQSVTEKEKSSRSLSLSFTRAISTRSSRFPFQRRLYLAHWFGSVQLNPRVTTF